MIAAASTVRVWAEMVKLSHSVFALPFALMSVFLAARDAPGTGRPTWGQLGLVVMAMVAGRSVAMTFNRIVDRAIDSRNPRTRGRPLPAGRIALTGAWAMLALSVVTFGVACLAFRFFYGNNWPILLSGPVLLYLCGYSYAKRFTRWSHVYLGSAIAFSPFAAWLAIDPASIGVTVILLMVIVTCWISGFDIIYACQDIDVDRREGLHSLPACIGPTNALRIARGLHTLVVAGLILLGAVAELGVLYATGVVMAAILLWVENAMVRPGDYTKVNFAFFTANSVVSVVLALTTIADVVSTVPASVP